MERVDVRRAPARQGLTARALANVFVAPSILLMAAVALFPVLFALVTSFKVYRRRNYTGEIGLANYMAALQDERFWGALSFTTIFTVVSVALEFVIGLAFALMLNRTFRGRGVARAAVLIPWVIPTVVAAQMWFFLFNVQPGFINNLFNLGPVNWLGQSGTAAFAVIFADVWKTAPFVALLLLAGLQTIPEDVYEAARVDGANTWQRFYAITLPLLYPSVMVALLFRTVDALRVYDLPQVMTGGAFDTTSLSMLVQQYIVRTPNPGMGAAFSTLTFLIVMGVGLFFIKLLGNNLQLGGGAHGKA